MIKRRKARLLLIIRHYSRSTRNYISVASRMIFAHWRIICLSSFSSLFLIILSYALDATPLPIGGEVSVGLWLERFRALGNSESDNIPDSIFLVNVTYDKTLVDYEARLFSNDSDSPKLPVGKITTTDRKKLYDFLSVADSLRNYRYILLDVRFEDDIENDSITEVLFSLIGKMDNIVFAMHESGNNAEGAPLEKAAYSDYHTTFLVSDVVKYPLLKRAESNTPYSLSIPAKIFSDLNNGSFTTLGLITYYNHRLCRRSVYPSFPIRITSWAKESDEVQGPIIQYHNLGEDLVNLDNYKEVIGDLINNRIVVIGDLVEDIHDTYIGLQPGALINLNSYIALCRDEHLISWLGLISQFALYFIISWCLIRRISVIDKIGIFRNKNYGVIRFLFSFISYSVILTVVSAIIYIFSGSIFSIALPSLYFTILESCRKLEFHHFTK